MLKVNKLKNCVYKIWKMVGDTWTSDGNMSTWLHWRNPCVGISIHGKIFDCVCQHK